MKKNNEQERPKCYNEAMKYQKQGLSVISVRKGEKRPDSGWMEFQKRKPQLKEIEEWFSGDMNIGIICGCVSGGLVVFDFDGNNWEKALNKFLNKFPFLSKTLRVITGSGKAHLWVRVTDLPEDLTRITRKFDDAQIELRANKHYVLVPPSLHPCGGKYKFADRNAPIVELSRTKLDKIIRWLKQNKTIEKKEEPTTDVPIESKNKAEKNRLAIHFLNKAITDIGVGSRHDKCFWLSCQLRDLALSQTEAKSIIESYVRSIPQTGHNYTIKEALTTLGSVFKTPPREPSLPKTSNLAKLMKEFSLKQGFSNKLSTSKWSTSIFNKLVTRPQTDAGNAECFRDLFKSNFCWVKEKNSWFKWNGVRWIENNEKVRISMVKTARMRGEVADSILESGPALDEAKKAGELKKWAKSSESHHGINAALSLAEPWMLRNYQKFDRKKYLLCCANGVVDLRTGKLRPAKPEDFLRLYTKIKFDPTAKCDRWLQFLDEIFKKEEELIDFIHRALGYTLTGSVEEECFFICYGEGANGKSTLFGVMEKLLGDLAITSPSSTFKERVGNDAIPNDIARMCGKRLVKCVELRQRAVLNEEHIKSLTGGDKLTGRFLYGEYFDFEPTHKIWLAVNKQPKIEGNDYGIWRRIREIPFNVQFQGKRRDNKLREKLKRELPGILNWAIQGCLEWQKRGLQPVAAVKQATNDYREECNIVGRFSNECAILEKSEKTQATDSYNAYCTWSRKVGEPILSMKEFSSRIRNIEGIEVKKIHGVMWYKGIRVLVKE